MTKEIDTAAIRRSVGDDTTGTNRLLTKLCDRVEELEKTGLEALRALIECHGQFLGLPDGLGEAMPVSLTPARLALREALRENLCARCAEPCNEGQVYCGAACSAEAEMNLPPKKPNGLEGLSWPVLVALAKAQNVVFMYGKMSGRKTIDANISELRTSLQSLGIDVYEPARSDSTLPTLKTAERPCDKKSKSPKEI